MSLGGSFCLICGAEPPLHADRLCEACLRERHVLFEIEPNLQYTVCRRCDAVERRGKWLPLVEEEVWDDLIETHLRLHPDVEGAQVGWVAHRVDERNTLLHIDGEGTIHGLEFRSRGPHPRSEVERGLPDLREGMGTTSRQPSNFVRAPDASMKPRSPN